MVGYWGLSENSHLVFNRIGWRFSVFTMVFSFSLRVAIENGVRIRTGFSIEMAGNSHFLLLNSALRQSPCYSRTILNLQWHFAPTAGYWELSENSHLVFNRNGRRFPVSTMVFSSSPRLDIENGVRIRTGFSIEMASKFTFPTVGKRIVSIIML